MKERRQQQPEQYEEWNDSDADAFAVVGILVIVALTVVYYLSG